MAARLPQAPHFYASECSPRTIDRYLAGFEAPPLPRIPVAGLVPHAGWHYSGAVAARVFECLRQRAAPATFVLLGAVHRRGVAGNSVWRDGDWETPLGAVSIDVELVDRLLAALGERLIVAPRAHLGEHSLEVQVPLIRYLFPAARIVPIATPPDRLAADFGGRLAAALAQEHDRVVVVGSTDLTHYGEDYGFAPAGAGETGRAWMRANDARMLELVRHLRAEEVVDEADARGNACGAGAIAATLAAARALGAREGTLLRYTTSHEVEPDAYFSRAVGYAGFVF